ncbi:MAG: hypothetical protein LPJ86_06465 [Caulobacteraceae bacterium]|nr:hypothetical protein [Caulobacteraceae bacterium]MDX5393450.1 hypothetical protein [Caulobacteraceae bacterium]
MDERDRDLLGSDVNYADRLRRTISYGLASIKSTIERGIPARALDTDPELARAWKRAVLQIEGIRVDHNTLGRRPLNRDRLAASLMAVHDGLAALLEDREFMTVAYRLPYRPMAPPPREPELDSRVYDRGATVPDMIANLIDLTRGVQRPTTAALTDIATLRRMVPSQKIAPVVFEIEGGRLVIVDQPADVLSEDKENVEASRVALIERGEQLLQALEQSNCDRRLVESVRELQVGLTSGHNIIQLGLSNLTCEAVCGAFQAELPEALCGKLQGHTRGISMYLAQFPDWQRFAEKAAAVDLDPDDIIRISSTAQTLITDLDSHPELADPRVPRTIAALREAINDPGKATKRAAFAVLRTIENLVAKAIEYGAELVESTVSKSIAELSTVTSKALAVGLLSLALLGASGLSPIAGKVSDTVWLRNVSEVVRNQLATASPQ